MKQFFVFKLLLVTALLLISSCTHTPVKPSVYYWKTTFKLTAHERDYLHDLKIQKLYLRFFDVDWDNERNSAVPVGNLTFRDTLPFDMEVVPVVYIVNKVLINSNKEDIEILGDHIFQKITAICNLHKIRYTEIQFDCDWTEQSRDKYFALLSFVSHKLKNEQFMSATIRLHQVKYSEITGVPPVKRGMLMFYNMGKISAKANYNSIYNKEEAALYTKNIKRYPLPLDVALPAFSWGVQLREGKVVRLLDNFTSSMLRNAWFEPVSGNYYKAKSSFFFHGYYFMKDDLIKVEECTPKLTLDAANELSAALNKQERSVSIYHCDSLIFTRYEKNDLSKIYHCFR
jgi:hypothetical protein